MYNNITDEMLSHLNESDKERLDYIIDATSGNSLVDPMVLRRFSDLAFSLAMESLRSGEGIAIAKILVDSFDQLINSQMLSIDTKKTLAKMISETKLDLIFASGNHKIASFRLSPFLMAHDRYN